MTRTGGDARNNTRFLLLSRVRGLHVCMCSPVVFTCSDTPPLSLSLSLSLSHTQMQSVEASMRLDAVASAGMGMSRSKLKVGRQQLPGPDTDTLFHLHPSFLPLPPPPPPFSSTYAKQIRIVWTADCGPWGPLSYFSTHMTVKRLLPSS